MLIAGHEIWVRRLAGDKTRLPLVVVNGGPGLSSSYLEPLEQLARDGREVVLYDPLGCGRSEHPAEPPDYSIEYYANELAELVSALHYECVNVLGHSAGAAVAFSYALREPRQTASVIAYSPIVDFDRWIGEQHRLRAAFPQDVIANQAMLLENYYRRHACRLSSWPEPLTKSFAELAEDPRVFASMYGADVFDLSGTLRGFTLLGRLHELACPVLLLSGRYDSATPHLMEQIRRRLRNAEQRVFDLSSHTAHLEEPQAFLSAVMEFLAARDRSAGVG